MEIVTGALPSVLTKLGALLVGGYNLQKKVKGEIKFLQSELESMKGALEKISNTPPDRLDIQDKIWARDLRELSYDIEDSIDTFMVRVESDESAKLYGLRKFVDRSVGLFRKAKIRHGIATDIKDIKSRVIEVHKRRLRYDVNKGIDKPPTAIVVDPRLFSQYIEAKELVGIDERRDELINVLMDTNGVPLQHGKIVSIIGFGGLGKTTLAKAVYEKIRALFDCCAFVSVSQTPDLKNFFKRLLRDLGKNIIQDPLDETWLIDVAREFLKTKRYLIVIDDIWDISVWEVIKCALPDNDVGYIVIITSRNADVAGKTGGAYNLKPLSKNNSRKLLYKRVFGDENNNNVEDTEKCPNKELAEVSDKILKKCAGVPLAIITMASLLSCKARNQMDWYEVYHSIGNGLQNNLDVDNMRKILSFSYYNMPSHLRTCLLYLVMFQEDCILVKDRLIWMWIAEGFIIHCEGQGKSLFEVGEGYFNALINRSMIQPIYDEHDSMISRCRVHDMVLDLICSLSREANFITISRRGMNDISPSSTIRRLSLQNKMEREYNTMAPAAKSFQQVRSIVVNRSYTCLIPVLGCFQVLRVMDLHNCDLSQGSLKCIGNLLHLRYLALFNTRIVQLPQEIGNLQFLQILDIRYNEIACLPSNVVQLKRLMCLKIDRTTRVSKVIGSLTSLEDLTDLWVDDNNTDIILEDLGQLTELRVLSISLDIWNGKLLEFVRKLQKIQDVTLWASSPRSHARNIGGLDAWVAPRCLSKLDIDYFMFSTLPAWMNPSHVPYLSRLSICIRELQQADLDILGRFQALSYLGLEVDHRHLGILGGFVVGAGSFPCMMSCWFSGFEGPVVFQQGAMPRLKTLESSFSVRRAIEVTSSDSVWHDLGMSLLPSLQDIQISLYSNGANEGEMKGLEATLWHASKIHPNRPILTINHRS